MKAPKGFTLIELVVALTLSTFVLVGIVSLSASLVRYQFEGIRKGAATGTSLAALDQMHREVENATHIQIPAWGISNTGDVLSGCSNWVVQNSPGISSTLVASAPIVAFYYCKSTAAHATLPNSLIRYEKTGACPFSPAPAACGDAVGGATMDVLAYKNFYYLDGFAYTFVRSTDLIRARYIVGNSTPTASVPVPVAYKFQIDMLMNTAYANQAD